MKHHFLLYLGLAIVSRLSAQIDIVDSGATSTQVGLNGVYAQNFDTLLASTPSSGVPWVNNTTIRGWYSFGTSYAASNHFAGLSSYGNGTDPERALGSVAGSWALRFVNSSSQTITGFNVSYTGEQWYRAANDPQGGSTMFFRYRKYAASVSESTEVDGIGGIANWTATPELNFNSPNQSDILSSILDGNATENRVFVNFTLTGIAVAPGEKLWLRWSAGSFLAQPHAIATDDVQVSFISTIPEPASFAAFAAAAALGVTLFHRRRRLPKAEHSKQS